MTVADLAIIAGLVFAWGTLPARLERFDMTAPIVFTAAGVLLTHGPLTPLGVTPSTEVVKVLTEATLVLVLFSDASRVGLGQLRADLGLCLRLRIQKRRLVAPSRGEPVRFGERTGAARRRQMQSDAVTGKPGDVCDQRRRRLAADSLASTPSLHRGQPVGVGSIRGVLRM